MSCKGGTARDLNRFVNKLRVFYRFALDLSDLSCCKRAKCGAVVTPIDFSEVMAIGYNGPPVGRANDSCRKDDGAGRCGCAHAEANCVVKLSSTRLSIMLSTTEPCETCAMLIVNRRNIRAVLYDKEYRVRDGHELLDAAGVLCEPLALLSEGRGKDIRDDLIERLFRAVGAPL